MQALAQFADKFMGLFRAGGETFVSFVTGIVPELVSLLLIMNALIKLIGTERIDRLASKSSANPITRYLIFRLSFLGLFA